MRIRQVVDAAREKPAAAGYEVSAHRATLRAGRLVTSLATMSSLVVKLGSSIVADERGAVRADVLAGICDQLAELHGAGESVIVVTSGAIARGMGVMAIPLRPRLSQSPRDRPC